MILTFLLASSSAVMAENQGAVFGPGLGDLMTMSVQPRHTKLGLAGQAKNWAYAAYEVGELREALDDVAEALPRWNGIEIASALKCLTADPLAAIKAADGMRFAQAYGQLTQACNACHHSAGKAMIVIQVPVASPFPNQDFRPVRK